MKLEDIEGIEGIEIYSLGDLSPENLHRLMDRLLEEKNPKSRFTGRTLNDLKKIPIEERKKFWQEEFETAQKTWIKHDSKMRSMFDVLLTANEVGELNNKNLKVKEAVEFINKSFSEIEEE